MRFSPSELHPPARGPFEAELNGVETRRRVASTSGLVVVPGARFSPSERPNVAATLLDAEIRPVQRAPAKRATPRTVAGAETSATAS
jgi:hypothetical protein